jgi:hypothetical protein
MKKYSILLLPLISFFFFANSCKDKPNPPDNNPIDTTHIPVDTTTYNLQNTLGFGILNKVKGIWNGPVTSTTGLGSYPEWIVDFRPISENQISAKNELDKLNDIHLSFFVAKYNGSYKVCFRNGGSFDGMTRVSYFLADSVSENASQSYYRFSEIIKGRNRAYTEVVFRNDSLLMKSYTNKTNSLTTPVLHMSWSAGLQDITSCANAVSHFNFPQKTMTKDFTASFTGQPETIFYSSVGADPYTESQQPYLGQATISYSFLSSYTPDPAKKVFLIITTQPLISGFTPNFANLKYRSRYVMLASNDHSFTFNYMHPGTYYLYAMYDTDGNIYNYHGDWFSVPGSSFTLPEHNTTTATTQINVTIP